MSIKDFFKDQEIFITGGSGFIGKALIEKIVRSCPDFSKIYVLLRAKKGKSINERLDELLQTKIFELARTKNPEGFKRIEAIEGDCAKIGLAIQAEDLKRMENVSIIYHSAASVRFDDPLCDAILLNTRGTWELLKIAETLKRLLVFLHVSTAFCNAEKAVIEEKVYEPLVDWTNAIKLAEQMDANVLDILSLKFSNFKPNTYCFTKALAEQVVLDYKDKLPVSIFRPAVVTNCMDDPLPGWIDNFNGPMGMLTASGMGILRYLNTSGKCRHSVIPIDIVIRAMIIATYKRASELKKGIHSDSVDVFNATIDSISSINLIEIMRLGLFYIEKNPYDKTLWAPGGAVHSNSILYNIKYFMFQLSMAVIWDGFLRLSGRKPIVLKLQRLIRSATNAILGFIDNEWDFKVESFFGLDKLVPSEEYDDFAFLAKSCSINWDAYYYDGIKGTKEFLLKESPESSVNAKRRFQIMRFANNSIVAIFYFLLIRYLYNLLWSWF